MNRRQFLRNAVLFISARGIFKATAGSASASTASNAKSGSTINGYDPKNHYYGMGIEVDKCIGCGKCVEACKIENNVPKEPFFTRTWVERYVIKRDKTVEVESIGLGEKQSKKPIDEAEVVRSFFVPKLCNQCDNPPCVQVCPVGATFSTEDGVVLVDEKRCIGCRYCIQACPYGARYLHPETKTADKCTFCYHRIVKGLLPACVEACPTQARIFGDLRSKASRLVRFTRLNKIHVLKAHLNTEPKVQYAGLDGEVR
jgi:tetrathionate reductase subunit B